MVDLAEYLDDKHEHLFSFKVRVLWKLTSYTPRLHFRLQLLWWQLTLKAYMLSWCLNKVANTANTYQLLELPSQNDESSKNRQHKCLVFCTPMRFWWIFGLPSSRSQLHRPGCGVPFADALKPRFRKASNEKQPWKVHTAHPRKIDKKMDDPWDTNALRSFRKALCLSRSWSRSWKPPARYLWHHSTDVSNQQI